MAHHVEVITPEQRSKENAVFWAIVLDVLLTAAMIVVGLFSDSMTVISEVARIVLLLTIEIVSYVVLKRAHRGQFKEFEFGIGKIERIINLLVAFGLCVTCLYISSRITSTVTHPPLSPTSLFWGVICADINLAINVWFSIEFIRVNKAESSIIVLSQIKSRIAKTVASAIVLAVLILALWLTDPRLARMVDIAGSIFVLCFMLVIATGLIRESLPEILDRSVPDPEQYQILKVLAEHFDRFDGFTGYRTRRSGKDLFILVTLGFLPNTTMSEIQMRLEPLRRDLESKIPGAKVTIVTEALAPLNSVLCRE